MIRCFIILFLLASLKSFGQCNIPQNTFANNVYFFSAQVNWNVVSGAHHYKIRYKEIGTSPWSYKNNIDSTSTSRVLNNLSQLTSYIWQIRAHCDTISNFSNWSQVDTFYTTTNICPTPNNLTTSNITHMSAQANWDLLPTAHRYKVHYRILNTNTWSNLSLINGNSDSTNIPVLQQNTTYEWQIMAFHDSTLNMGSLWSQSDTFTTSTFIPAPFNPIVNTSLGSTICNSPSSLLVEINQVTNEPDIDNSTITTDGGYFDIGSVNTGDSVGYASYNSTTQNINSTLRAGLIVGPNYAIINSFDSNGDLIGFFAIENTSTGVRVSTTSPNDGNNYTTGYTSQVNFTNLFITPNVSGNLHIVIDIESELNDQIYYSDTVFIQCPSAIYENINSNQIIETYDIYGRKIIAKKNTICINRLNNGRVTKQVVIE
ncbi:MAG: hypothetical protein CMP72_02695 [Flavobacteriales bacterium]|nr:hypothetical protein [Flavobacteriales bacterium]